MKILQIIPNGLSTGGGVSDYASILGEKLRSEHKIEASYLICRPREGEPSDCNNVDLSSNCIYLTERTAASLFKDLDSLFSQHRFDLLVLHYSGYGYSRRGVPLWLVDGLKKWLASRSTVPLVTVFHELYATSSNPTKSSFWLQWVQAQITKRIWSLSAAATTTNNYYGTILDKWRQGNQSPVLLSPVFSNLGEPVCNRRYCDRSAVAVILGSSATASLSYHGYAQEIQSFLKAHDIERIVDIGTRNFNLPEALGDIPIKALGRQSAERISKLLRDCRFGVISYNSGPLGKSGVFAAYSAHGSLPVCFSDSVSGGDGLMDGENFLLNPRRTFSEHNLQKIQKSAYEWYQPHRLNSFAENFVRSCLRREPTSERIT